MLISRTCLLLLCCLVLLTGCATNPLSKAQSWDLEKCADFDNAIIRFKRADGSLFATIPRTTCSSALSAAKKIQIEANVTLTQIYIVDLKDPNAFATKDKNGNPIAVVTIGMLQELESDEDAWAGLMGHEIAHLVRQHGEGRASAQGSAKAGGEIVSNILAHAIPGVGGFVAGTVFGTATQNALYGSYTRPQEAEADQLGLKYMVSAGYDPQGMLRLFEVLAKHGSSIAFLSTHPATDDRSKMVQNFLNETGVTKPTSAENASPEAIRQQEIKFIVPEMIAIPGKNYEIGKYEVTQAEWQAVMSSNPSEFKGANLPVQKVSWHDVLEYIKKLNQKTGKQYRLPNESEWEYACYGGSQTEYCGGNDLNAVGWHTANSDKHAHPVGQRQANGYGLYDMSGNVWEWMEDCSENDCTKRILRGGSWKNDPRYVRVESRLWNDTSSRTNLTGFRLTRTLP